MFYSATSQVVLKVNVSSGCTRRRQIPREVDAQFHVFLKSPLHGGVCRFTPTVKMVGGTFCRKEKNLALARNRNTIPLLYRP